MKMNAKGLAVASALLASSVGAADFYWRPDGDGLITNAANWTADPSANADPRAPLYFTGGAASYGVTVPRGVTYAPTGRPLMRAEAGTTITVDGRSAVWRQDDLPDGAAYADYRFDFRVGDASADADLLAFFGGENARGAFRLEDFLFRLVNDGAGGGEIHFDKGVYDLAAPNGTAVETASLNMNEAALARTCVAFHDGTALRAARVRLYAKGESATLAFDGGSHEIGILNVQRGEAAGETPRTTLAVAGNATVAIGTLYGDAGHPFAIQAAGQGVCRLGSVNQQAIPHLELNAADGGTLVWTTFAFLGQTAGTTCRIALTDGGTMDFAAGASVRLHWDGGQADAVDSTVKVVADGGRILYSAAPGADTLKGTFDEVAVGAKGLTIESAAAVTLAQPFVNKLGARGVLRLVGPGAKTLGGSGTTVAEIAVADGSLTFAAEARVTSAVTVTNGAKVAFGARDAANALAGLVVGDATSRGTLVAAPGETVRVNGPVSFRSLAFERNGSFGIGTSETIVASSKPATAETIRAWETAAVLNAEDGATYTFTAESDEAGGTRFRLTVTETPTVTLRTGTLAFPGDIPAGSPSARLVVDTADKAAAAVLKADAPLTLGGLVAQSGALVKRGAASVTIRLPAGVTNALAASNGTGKNGWDPADTSVFAFDASGAAPTTGYLGFNVAEGNVTLMGGEGACFKLPYLALVGMPVSGGLAQPSLTVDGVALDGADAILHLGAYLGAGAFATSAWLDVVNGADCRLACLSVARASSAVASAPTVTVTRAALRLRDSLRVNAVGACTSTFRFSDGALVCAPVVENYGGCANLTVANALLAADASGAPLRVDIHHDKGGVWSFSDGAVFACRALSFDKRLAVPLTLAFGGATWRAGDAENALALSNADGNLVIETTTDDGLALAVMADQTVRLAHPITGRGGVVKTGAGTLCLDAPEAWSFEGPLDVREGTVRLATGLMRTGARLRGAGTLVGGAFANATIESGNATARLTLDGVTFTGMTRIDFGRDESDPVRVPQTRVPVAAVSGAAPDVSGWRAKGLGVKGAHARFSVDEGVVYADIDWQGTLLIIR